jgi:hypothetical protein
LDLNLTYTIPAMIRILVFVLLATPLSFTQTPVISLRLPDGIPSEQLQIQYFMTGSFGGFGNFIRPIPNLNRYMIPASVGGEPAHDIKVMAYMPGCEFSVLDILVQGNAERQIVCEPLGNVALHGKISPQSVAQGKDLEVSIVYLAKWQFDLEGIKDWHGSHVQHRDGEAPR